MTVFKDFLICSVPQADCRLTVLNKILSKTELLCHTHLAYSLVNLWGKRFKQRNQDMRFLTIDHFIKIFFDTCQTEHPRTSGVYYYTANISAVKITVFRRVRFPTVFPLYFLHSITAPSTVEKCKH